MDSSKGLGQAGTILLLIGAILSAVGAVFMLMVVIGVGAFITAMGGGGAETALITGIYGVLAALLVGGAIFGFLAYGKAKQNDASGAFLFGLISALMPPLQIIPLIGAIFCKVAEDD